TSPTLSDHLAFFLSILPRPPTSPLFPYTTLFRSSSGGKVVKNVAGYDLGKLFCGSHGRLGLIARASLRLHPLPASARTAVGAARSEEHTSELQSLTNLVCRLLLEKKKHTKYTTDT